MRKFLAASVFAFGLALAAALFAGTAQAGPYPDRPIKVIVPYGQGGVDLQLRLAGPFMSKLLGQPIVVENRAGGGATIGTTAVRNSPPDGYTLLFTGTAALTVVPHMRRVSYKMDDFVPIGNVTGTALVVVTRADAPYRTIAELVGYAKANPTRVNMASTGVGTTTHMVGEAFQLAAGVKFTHVPHTGNSQIAVAMMNQSADLVIGVPGSYLTQAQAGKLRVLASAGSKRSEFVPEVPTLKEAGYDVIEETKFGLLAPKGLAPEAVEALTRALQSAVASAEFVEKMRANYVTPHYLNPAEFAAVLRQEDRYWSGKFLLPEFRALKE